MVEGRVRAAAILCVLAPAVSGCGTGAVRVSEVYYLGAAGGGRTAYYRIRVNAEAALGEAAFRQGWFPAGSVDALFGDVSEEGGRSAVRDELRRQIDEAVIEAQRRYLAALLDPATEESELEAALEALRRTRVASWGRRPFAPGTVAMEYDPRDDLVLRRSGHKLVFVLASDPDEVIGALAGIAEEERTEDVIAKLTEILARKVRGDGGARERRLLAQLEIYTAAAARMESVAARLARSKTARTRERILAEIDALTAALEAAGE